MSRLRKRSLACLAILGLLASGCANSMQGDVAPAVELKDLSGNAVNLNSLRGHPVMLDFWATWCGPCQISIPLVQKFYMKHKDEGLVVLGMNIDDDPSGVQVFVERFGMTYPVLLAGASTAPSDYRVEGIPAFIFIDRKGRITRRFVGFSERMVDEWEAELKELLLPY